MRTPISRKIFLLFLPLTSISLLFGVIVYFGLNRLQQASEQISQLKDFQLQLKELETWQQKIAFPHWENNPFTGFAESIGRSREMADGLLFIHGDLPQVLRMRLAKIPFFMDNFSRIAQELTVHYATDQKLPKTSDILLDKLHARSHKYQSRENQQQFQALNSLLARLPKLRRKVYHDRDISVLPELHGIIVKIKELAGDRDMVTLAEQFVGDLEGNYLNFLGIQDRKAFLHNTSEQFFQVSTATLLAIEQRSNETRQFFLQAVIGITLLAIFINLLCWYGTSRYFNRFLTHQQQLIRSIRKHEDLQLPELPDDEIGDLTTTLRQVLLKRRETEAQLEQSEARLTRLVANAADAIFLFNEQGRFELVNKQACTSLGYGEEELLQLSVTDIDAEYTKEKVLDVTEEKHPAIWPLTTTGIHRRKDGSTFPVEIRVDVMETEKGIRFVALARDVSRQAALEEQLRQAIKMEAMGTLAGGIAHDFNNILAAILGYAGLIKQEVEAKSAVGKNVREILVAGNRAADLVKQILTFSRKGDRKKSLLQASAIVKEALKMLRSTLPTTIQIEEDIRPECGVILMNATTMHQIVVNLCTNGAQSMPQQKGILRVRLKQRGLNEKDLQGQPGLSPGAYVLLTVSDNGQGIEQATMNRIFEPYFTTKGLGRGTGLGLAVVHGAVQECKGFMEVESSVGQGSTFSVYLPVVKPSAVQDIVAKKKKRPAIGGNEHILVVDDEPMLARVHKKHLENMGYQVVAVSDSREALALFEDQPDNFDLLITDQTMPGLTGLELAQAVLKLQPSMPIIMCTGHSDTVSEEKALSQGIQKYVIKPLHGDELLEAIREILDNR